MSQELEYCGRISCYLQSRLGIRIPRHHTKKSLALWIILNEYLLSFVGYDLHSEVQLPIVRVFSLVHRVVLVACFANCYLCHITPSSTHFSYWVGYYRTVAISANNSFCYLPSH